MSQPAHLLAMTGLHTNAPGSLDVVFGPDGEFEGAPEWRPALYMLVGRRFVHDWLRTDDTIWLDLPPHGRVAHGQVALDLRIPSVAARLAGLCARALSLPGISYSLSWSAHERGGYVLSRPMEQHPGRPYMAAWGLDGLPIRCYSDADAPLPPPVPVRTDRRSLEEFLAALTLALAPRIAALATASPR